MLGLNEITAGYGGREVLRGLCAEIKEGELTAVIGVNGSGKSTLLRAAAGILPLKGGTVSVDGTPLTAMGRAEIARHISYLPQQLSSSQITVAELVLGGRLPHLRYPRVYRSYDRELAERAMECLGIGELADAPLPTLSGGLRQSAYLAMAVCQDARYLLLDEPTAYLDPSHALKLMGTLRSLSSEGRGILAVMHDLPMAFTYFHRILLVDGGRVAASGTPCELFDSEILKSTMGVRLIVTEEGYCYGGLR